MISRSNSDRSPVTRREFLGCGTAGLVAASGLAPGPGASDAAGPTPPAARPWYRRAWRRAVIDMHIPDWDEKFLSRFDPDEYVGRLIESRAQSVVCYAHSHVGLFNYPTKVGQQHRGLKGRDIVAEMIARCHARGIAV